jgi:hypothetical protein
MASEAQERYRAIMKALDNDQTILLYPIVNRRYGLKAKTLKAYTKGKLRRIKFGYMKKPCLIFETLDGDVCAVTGYLTIEFLYFNIHILPKNES